MEGKQFGHYQVISELGRGGMGVVYKAHEMSLNRHVAIKVLAKHLAGEEQLVSRFIREAKSAASLNHPNVIQIFFIGEQDSEHYFVMEYVEGTSLSGLIREMGQVPLDRAVQILTETASALEAAHARGIIHRDIKPANIMLTRAGLVKVTDFGIAFMPDPNEKLTATGQFMGTPGYLPPEPYHGSPMDQRSDIFSLGIVFYEMLTGNVPFKATSPVGMMREVIEGSIPPVAGQVAGVDQEIQRILNRMTAKDPEARYPDCTQLLQDIHAWRGTLQPGAASFAPPPIPGAAAKAAGGSEHPTHTSLFSAPPLKPTTPPPIPSQDAPPTPQSSEPPPLPQAEPITPSESAPSEPPVRSPTGPAAQAAVAPPSAKKRSPLPIIAALALGMLLLLAVILLVLKGDDDSRPEESEPPLTHQSAADTQTAPAPADGPMDSAPDPSATDTAMDSGATTTEQPADSAKNDPQPKAKDTANSTSSVANGPAKRDDTTPQRDVPVSGPVDSPSPIDPPTASPKPDGAIAGALSADRTAAKSAPAMSDRSVAVLVQGDPALEGPLHEILSTYLGNETFQLYDPAVDLSSLPNRTPAAAGDVRRAIPEDSGIRWVILVQETPTGSRELSTRGASTLYQSRLRFTLYDLKGPKKLNTQTQNIEFTTLNARPKAEKAALEVYDTLTAPMKP